MGEGRKCLTCGRHKSAEDFYRRTNGSIRSECKMCAYDKQRKLHLMKLENNDVEYFASRMATQAIQRCKPSRNNHYSKNNIKCLFTSHKEFKEYLIEEFSEDIEELLKREKTPSIDRINPSGNYEVGNIRVIDFEVNNKLGREEFARRNSKPVRCVNPSGEELVFSSVKDAAISLGKARKTVRHYANNGGTTRDGFAFEFIIEEDD